MSGFFEFRLQMINTANCDGFFGGSIDAIDITPWQD
jgi:hypothetical protein